MQALFSNILDIKNLNELFLNDLSKAEKSLGEIFLSYTEYFKCMLFDFFDFLILMF